ncbi:unnamed protein product [Brachionus calyciflorus]|uniref:ISXO2-like transposase domain-containing protein n=1 Tax=Brachionus calyciflorus TaxID=104777 RepID=A0A813QD96_9BILA|nr:unnamed protein product [Brachionus calyciflorus]
MSVFDSEEYKLFLKVKEKGLVFPSRNCENIKCKKNGQIMPPSLRKKNKDSINTFLIWRCTTCGHSKTVYDESFFSLFRKPIKILLAIMKCWAAQLTVTKTKSVIELNFKQRRYFLGDTGRIVEIDESMYCKVKHWKGKDLGREQVWVFGLVERLNSDNESKFCLEIVKNRDALTLIKIICNTCEPETLIFSDSWSSCNKIKDFKNFKHMTVNHSVNFVDPATGTCTNKIESLWNSCKYKFKEMRGCIRDMVQSHIDEFIWRYNNKVNVDRKKAYDRILEEISIYYRPGYIDEETRKKLGKLLELNNDDGHIDVESETASDGSSDTESESGSDCGSLFSSLGDFCDIVDVNVLDGVIINQETDEIEQNLDEKEKEFYKDDDDVEEKTKSVTASSTIRYDNDNDKDKFITKLSTKERAKLYEIKSNEKPSSSNETVEQIKKVLSNKQDPVECPECGKYMSGAKGLKIQISRSHS